MEWTPYSPGLNPIEHCWKCLKEKLQNQYPELRTCGGGKVAIQAKLREVLPEVWGQIESDYLHSLCRSRYVYKSKCSYSGYRMVY